jgi:Protein of unknown function (DUF2946)
MDEAVIASMAKWPNVPDCYGWLHLDAKGRWLMGERSEGQHASVVAHEGLKGFMNRNYVQPRSSAHPGGWALQNGPQRVWVTLALAPFIVDLNQGQASAHTGQEVSIEQVILADDGVVYLQTNLGPAALSSASMDAFSQGLLGDDLEHAQWLQASSARALTVQHCSADQVEALLGFKRNCAAP